MSAYRWLPRDKGIRAAAVLASAVAFLALLAACRPPALQAPASGRSPFCHIAVASLKDRGRKLRGV